MTAVRKQREFFVYIVASRTRRLYIGVTNNLFRRIYEHKHKLIPGFTERYNINRLVYYEIFSDVCDAILREKQLKGWRRAKKIQLIESFNPEWRDLAEDWYKEETLRFVQGDGEGSGSG